jgi:hypothetical protein
MLQNVPTMLPFYNSNNNDDGGGKNDTEHEELAKAYFHSINSQLVTYEQLQECVPPILEPVINNCGADVVITHVLSFL